MTTPAEESVIRAAALMVAEGRCTDQTLTDAVATLALTRMAAGVTPSAWVPEPDVAFRQALEDETRTLDQVRADDLLAPGPWAATDTADGPADEPIDPYVVAADPDVVARERFPLRYDHPPAD